MGWSASRDLGTEHEGFVIGLLPDSQYTFRDCRRDDEPQQLHYVQAGCHCGWRSPVVYVRDASWSPSYAEVSDDDRDRLIQYWEREHIKRMEAGQATIGSRGVCFTPVTLLLKRTDEFVEGSVYAVAETLDSKRHMLAGRPLHNGARLEVQVGQSWLTGTYLWPLQARPATMELDCGLVVQVADGTRLRFRNA